MKTQMYFVGFFFAILAILLSFIYWSVGKSLPRYQKLEVGQNNSVPIKKKVTDSLKVISYNIGHGQGIKDNPIDWRNKEETLHHLNEIANFLQSEDADIVMLQEADLNSHRTYYVNQIEYILKKAAYPYYACSVIWDKNYLPYPFLPLSGHLGRMLSAICILSKFPIKENERYVFDKPDNLAFWMRLGYIDRGVQRIVIEANNKLIQLFNLHLEAWGERTREKQMGEAIAWIKSYGEMPSILGGDFNTVPLEASKKNDFIDDIEADYTNETTISLIWKSFADLNWMISVDDYKKNEGLALSFPSNEANRALDNIFSFNGLKIRKGGVLSQAQTASDHLPVYAEVIIP